MPEQVTHWIELTAVIILAIWLFRPRRKPPSHPLPSGDAVVLLRRLLAQKGKVETRWFYRPVC